MSIISYKISYQMPNRLRSQFKLRWKHNSSSYCHNGGAVVYMLCIFESQK